MYASAPTRRAPQPIRGAFQKDLSAGTMVSLILESCHAAALSHNAPVKFSGFG
jgi:hypothetical protein